MDHELLALSGAAIAGFILSGYANSMVNQWFGANNQMLAIGGIVAGVALLGVALYVIKSNEGWMGPVRMALGVAGVVLALRGVLSITGLEAQLAPITMGVI